MLDRTEQGRSTGTLKPRIAFLGTGWIGLNRMEAMVAAGSAEVVAVCDPSEEMRSKACELASEAEAVGSLEEVLDIAPDGIVIATPSALHAGQAIAALERGIAVFCQKPLGRTAAEVEEVVAAAAKADRLLGVDLSYRCTEGMTRIRDLVRAQEFGHIFAVELEFHNAYGPDKDWFYNRTLSGGGCLIDLGVHLADLALWTLDFPQVETVQGGLFRGGRRLGGGSEEVEDYAAASIRLQTGTSVRLSCSWNLHAGQDAVISARFFGTEGSAQWRNVGGSFFDFTAERYRGTAAEVLACPPDDWGPRAACAWLRQLSLDPGFDPGACSYLHSAQIIDRIYGR
ncbi:Gfo/Idh/MocA family oxidoreductase [Microbaculum marinum]|uniref:Gfo/Idh/MocA family oxidoreductase n=1 Tax=Microbaculum marinum TaxID=1764581 RepID=A0AAW9RJV5_9HYPH